MGAFMLDIKRFTDKVDLNVKEVLQKLSLDMFTRIVMMSPVRTGRFRNNWYTGIGTPSGEVNWSSMSPEGAASLGRIRMGSEMFGPGKVIYLSNNLPYANRLEYGYSMQAPAGMVRVSIASFQAFVDSAAAGVRK
jgi:hypothetical protein